MALRPVELKFGNLFLNHVALARDRLWTRFYKEQGKGGTCRALKYIPTLFTGPIIILKTHIVT